MTQAGQSGSRLSITLRGDGECDVRHAPSDARLLTSRPPEFGGTGSSFSSTDLLAAALGACIATDIETLAVRHGIELSAIEIEVGKELSRQPKKVEAFRVVIRVPGIDDGMRLRLERASGHCLVRRSLDPGIRVSVEVRNDASVSPVAGGEAK